jgi:hypothetical protein
VSSPARLRNTAKAPVAANLDKFLAANILALLNEVNEEVA